MSKRSRKRGRNSGSWNRIASASVKSILLRWLSVRCSQAGIQWNDLTIPQRIRLVSGDVVRKQDMWEWLQQDYDAAVRSEAICPLAQERLALLRMKAAPKPRTPIQKALDAEKAERKRQRKQARREYQEQGDGFFKTKEWRELRFKALKRADGCCVLCGRSQRVHGVILHVDHIKPRSRFPSLAMTLANLQILCEDCNLGKGNKDTTDWRPVNVIALPSKGDAA